MAAALDDLRALPGGSYLAGIRHPLLTEPDADWLARPDVRRGLAALASAGLTFDLVLQPSQLPAAVRAAAALPELTFVLDHLGNVDVETGPEMDQSWAAPFSDLAALPNTVCKLSGILSVPGRTLAQCRRPRRGRGHRSAHLRPYFDLALECFGPSRLMFGSDWPVCTLSASYAHVVAAAVALTRELSELEQAAILAGTARRSIASPRADAAARLTGRCRSRPGGTVRSGMTVTRQLLRARSLPASRQRPGPPVWSGDAAGHMVGTRWQPAQRTCPVSYPDIDRDERGTRAEPHRSR